MKISLHFRITNGWSIAIAVLLFFNASLHAQKWEKIQPDILYAQDKDKGLNVKIGIGTDQPTAMLDVIGRTKFRGNAYFDSLLIAFIVQCDALYVQNDAAIKGSAHINKEAHVNGILTVGSTLLPCPKCGPGSGGSGIITVDGIIGSIISSSGKIDLDGNELKTTGRIISDFATISKQLSAGNITIQTNTNGIGSIISSSGEIDFDGNDLITTGNVNSSNISALQTSVSNQQTQIPNLNSQ